MINSWRLYQALRMLSVFAPEAMLSVGVNRAYDAFNVGMHVAGKCGSKAPQQNRSIPPEDLRLHTIESI